MIIKHPHHIKNFLLIITMILLSIFVSACNDSKNESPPPTTIEEKEHIEQSSTGNLILDSKINQNTFLALDSVITLLMEDTTLSNPPNKIRVINNGSDSKASVEVIDNKIIINNVLEEGRNDIVVMTQDSEGHDLNYFGTFWAGSQTLTIDIRKSDGAIPSTTNFTAQLSDDPTVGIKAVITNGQIIINNVPDRTILMTAISNNNESTATTTIGSAGNILMVLNGFNTASEVDNNNFSNGLEGWIEEKNSSMSLIDHLEDININETPVSMSLKSAQTQSRTDASSYYLNNTAVKQNQVAKLATTIDQDLQVTTLGEGPSKVSRTFTTKPGTSNIKVRYRFITSEIPGGYFGSEYNDSFSISVRTLKGGSSTFATNSMNGLGLKEFSSDGSTGWKMLSIPVSNNGDTIQVDLTVSNVADDLLDSKLIIDYIEENPINVTVNLKEVCPNETVTYTASGDSVDSVVWTGGGTPPNANGSSLVTRYTLPGIFKGTAMVNGHSASETVTVKKSSGNSWVAEFPTSILISDLSPTFQGNVLTFISALKAGQAQVSINATYRPRERAYLMHWAYKIAKGQVNPESVPSMKGVDICWVHRNVAGDIDLSSSRQAAQQMVNAYGIVYAPALVSRHTERLAIDMNISWPNELNINGVTIKTTPRTGSGNTDLHSVGATYNVLKLASDPPHWSDDGH